METYLLKTILCSSVFIGFYYLILERQKAHQFKRFYLLFSMLFSIFIPFLSITYGVEKPVANDFIFIENSDAVFVPVVEETSVFTLENIVYTVYFIVTLVLFTRFLISLNALRKEINSGTKIKRGNYFLVIKEEKSTAHSFWKYIFLNKTDFENGTIDDKIIRHEEAHLQQKHSLDILLIEFLLTIFWFNPAFYFYKKAMITNHEFLADEAVLKNENDIKSYQKLLLTELISERILFTNPFNLSNTKKRIKMMTTPKNNKSKLLSWLSLPLAAVVFFAFVEKVPAQLEKTDAEIKPKADSAVVVNLEKLTNEERKMIESKTIGIKWDDAVKMVERQKTKTSENPYEEFKKIFNKYGNFNYSEFMKKLTDEDKRRLNELYPLLTLEQKNEFPIVLVDITGKYVKSVPTAKQLKDYSNTKIYGVWIDGKRVQNSSLKNFKPSDFSNVMSSIIHKNTVDYGKYKYHVSLMTNKYFDENNKKESIMVGYKKGNFDGLQNIDKGNNTSVKVTAKIEEQQTETPAEFPGGMNALRNSLMVNTDVSKINFDQKKKLAGTVYFNVLEDGKTVDIFVESNDKVFEGILMDAANKTIKGVQWKPGTKYGKPVDSQLKIPITMKFE